MQEACAYVSDSACSFNGPSQEVCAYAFDSARSFNDSSQEVCSYSPDEVCFFNHLTSRFYEEEAASFSATRQAPWSGWQTVVCAVPRLFEEGKLRLDTACGGGGECVAAASAESAIASNERTAAASAETTTPFHLLDVGCGNFRFERFLAERLVSPLHVQAFDNCPALVEEGNTLMRAYQGLELNFTNLDLAEALLTETLGEVLPTSESDLAVCFGVMHHIPNFESRVQLLASLLCAIKPGGFVAVSFWQFLNDKKHAKKAREATARAGELFELPALHENDFFLGWQHNHEVFRFCHHTSVEEIRALLAALVCEVEKGSVSPFLEVNCFQADGKNTPLNCYLILQRL